MSEMIVFVSETLIFHFPLSFEKLVLKKPRDNRVAFGTKETE